MPTENIAFLTHKIFECDSNNFENIALDVFNFQYENNVVYRSYCDLIKTNPTLVKSIVQIPFLPIQFFKNKIIKTTEFNEVLIFESSGTTQSVNSRHFVKDASLYEQSFITTFKQFYGDVSNYCIIGLLPSYLERKGSSLVYMVNDLIKKSNDPQSGFYLYDYEKLKQVLLENESKKKPTILIGVTYALVDFAEKNELKLSCCYVMETGGMKGRREEMTRKEVHHLLKNKLGLQQVHSEYGMTELLSQAYAKKDGLFNCSPWMQVLVRSEDDPFDVKAADNINGGFVNGALNIIDLANIYSCSFIATDDAGKLFKDGSFEITGRLENSDIRGCSLMVM